MTTTDCRTRSTLERKEAIKEAPRLAGGEQQGCTERGGSTPCVNQRLPRLVQTGGGRGVTQSSTQLVSLGRLLLFG